MVFIVRFQATEKLNNKKINRKVPFSLLTDPDKTLLFLSSLKYICLVPVYTSSLIIDNAYDSCMETEYMNENIHLEQVVGFVYVYWQ